MVDKLGDAPLYPWNGSTNDYSSLGIEEDELVLFAILYPLSPLD